MRKVLVWLLRKRCIFLDKQRGRGDAAPFFLQSLNIKRFENVVVKIPDYGKAIERHLS
jgi:hypothetical protein